MSSDSENNSNPLYNEYLEDDDDYCHLSSDQIPIIVNFAPASFVHNGQPSFQLDWSIDQVGNAISDKSIPSLIAKYEIPSSIELRKSQIGEFASQPPFRAVAFYLDFFRYGVRLPLHPFLRYMLIYLNCALAQLCLSVWCAMIGMYILWKLRGFSDPTFSQFQRIYQLMSLSSNKDSPLKGWYFVRAWAISSPLLAQGKSNDGSWKDSWFFALRD